jgi:hypothetical protein
MDERLDWEPLAKKKLEDLGVIVPESQTRWARVKRTF